ncbi:UDP-N-acetylmuramate dehydrogenase [Pseudidiomarina salilacus]|uniref:UDP-N-acetylmuramate dehydrogenase n=1 Tax=Pseudidiomarina salilacus TaxID=3384452 RepID=UPI0039854625
MTTILNNTSLKSLHTFRLPYSARKIIEITDAAALAEIEDAYYVLGEGSNTIFTSDFEPTLVRMAIKGIKVERAEDAYYLSVGAGENWHQLVEYTLAHDMPGLENLALIPGSVGAAPVQNIGAYGVEIGQYIHQVRAWDKQSRTFMSFNQQACQFAYRDSLFKRNANRYVIVEVTFRLPHAWEPTLNYGGLTELAGTRSASAIKDAVIQIRQSKLPDPKEIPNAGSFFKNPVISQQQYASLLERYPQAPSYPTADGNVKVAAGWLIDTLGLKGFSIGGAAVHTKQALVLINKANATGADILQLANEIKRQVADAFSIELEIEVRLLNHKELIS